MGHQLLAFRKCTKKSCGREREEVRLESQERPSVNAALETISISVSAPCSQISICGSNDPASGPCGQSRSRPVIKMKWAADPMVPFRRVEH